MIEQNLELAGNLRGGLFQSFMRRFTTGESLFQQEIKASLGHGQCLLSPNIDGDMQILNIGPQQYTLSDGAFVAATEHVNVKAKIQANLGGGFFGDTGGFCGDGIIRTRSIVYFWLWYFDGSRCKHSERRNHH